MTEKNEIAILCYLGDKDLEKVSLSKEELSIGSASDNNLQLPFGHISRCHAKIFYDPSLRRFWVIDLNSTNGTYVDGNKIKARTPYPLAHETRLQFGQIIFLFRYIKPLETGKCDVSGMAKFKKTIPISISKNKGLLSKTIALREMSEKLKGIMPGQTITSGNNISYRMGEVLHSRGMGVLCKAQRLNDHLNVAIKFLPTNELKNKKSVFRFINEARILMELKHKNLANALDFHHDPKCSFYVMEYLEGMNIEQMIKVDGYLSIPFATKVVLDISEALIYLEKEQILHRDIKPQNIVYTDEIAKLVDFGIAKSDNFSFTTAGFVLGTPFYISPEQAKGEPIDIRSEIYSLGASYYHMVTGSLPFEFANMGELISKRFSAIPIRANKVNPAVPAELAQLLEKMMQPKRNKRISSPQELFNLLQKFLSSGE